jgi:hypothetical protein
MKNRARPGFSPLQAQRVNRAFRKAGVDYLFIGKSGAILLGYPAVTQDVDLFVPKSEANGRKIVRALRKLGFTIGAPLKQAILAGTDFVQIKSGHGQNSRQVLKPLRLATVRRLSQWQK